MDKFKIHKLSYKNDIKNIKILLKKDIKLLYTQGINGEFPIHIACFIGSEELINLILKYDKKIFSLRNANKETGLHILVLHPELLMKYLNSNLINKTDNQNNTIFDLYVIITDNINIIIIKKMIKLGGKLNNLTKIDCNKIKILSQNMDLQINEYDQDGLTLLHYAIRNKQIDCIKTLINLGANIKMNGIDGHNNIFENVIRYSNDEIIEYFLTFDLNYEYTNRFSDTYLHSILMAKNIKFSKKIINTLLLKMNDLNIQNIDGDTIIHLLIKYNLWKQYIDILKTKKIKILLLNKEGKTPLDYLNKNDKKIFINKVFNGKVPISNDEKCKIKELKLRKVDYTLFTSYARDTYLYNIILLEKYPQLALPSCLSSKVKKMELKNNLSSIEIKFWKLIKYLYNKYPCILCSELYWHSSKLNFIFPDFDKCLKHAMKKDYVFFNINIINLQINHANILIIDNKMKTIERFEPLGINNMNEMDKFDKYIQKKLGLNYTYLAPKDFLRTNSFQYLSNHSNNQKLNDAVGFCVAWCYWYLEMRLSNPKIKQQILVKKMENKLITNKNIEIIEYIRSYADKLNIEKMKLLKEFNFSLDVYYKLYPSNNDTTNLFKKIFQRLSGLM